MIIDTISIVGCAVVIIIAVVSAIMNPFFRKVDFGVTSSANQEDQNGCNDATGTTLPKISVLVLAHNNYNALDAHLPIILTQDYTPGFEVIVVGEQGDLQTEGVVAQFAQCKNLYATYIPAKSLFMSKSKLAVALGVKAAHNEWIVLVDAESKPISDVWLLTLAKHMNNNTNLVIGYSNYEPAAPSFIRFHRLLNDCYLLRKALRSTAYRSNGTNIAFRRSEFIENDGYRGNLQYVNGEYDFIINKYARPYSTQTAIEQDAIIHENLPTKKAWNDRNVFYHHIRKRLERSASMRLLYYTDVTLLYANYMVAVVFGVYGGMTQRWLLLGVALLCFILTIIMRCMIAGKVFKRFNEDIPVWKVPFFELAMLWSSVFTHIRYAKSDKRDFTTHKL